MEQTAKPWAKTRYKSLWSQKDVQSQMIIVDLYVNHYKMTLSHYEIIFTFLYIIRNINYSCFENIIEHTYVIKL